MAESQGADRVWRQVFAPDFLPHTDLPFKDEFVAAIRREYPDLEVVEGTHPFHDAEAFKKGIRELSTQRAVTPQKMNDIVFRRIKVDSSHDKEPSSEG